MVTRSASSIEDSFFSSSFCSGSYVTGLYLALAVVSICANLKTKILAMVSKTRFWSRHQSGIRTPEFSVPVGVEAMVIFVQVSSVWCRRTFLVV